MRSQRRNLLKDEYNKNSINDELDHIHNQISSDNVAHRNVGGNYLMVPEDNLISCTKSGITVTLPSAPHVKEGKTIVVKDTSFVAATNNIVINSAEGLVNNSDQVKITTNGGSFSFYSDGKNWLTH